MAGAAAFWDKSGFFVDPECVGLDFLLQQNLALISVGLDA